MTIIIDYILVSLSFTQRKYRKDEHKGPLCLKLKLSRSVPVKIKVKIDDISYTATGELTDLCITS